MRWFFGLQLSSFKCKDRIAAKHRLGALTVMKKNSIIKKKTLFLVNKPGFLELQRYHQQGL